MLTFIATTATLCGLVAALLPAIQIAKIVRARCSHGISIPYLAGGLANNAVWTVYAFAFHSVALILPNVLGLLMNITMLAVAIQFRPRTAGRQPVQSVAHIAKAVVHDDELAAEFAILLAEEHEQRIAEIDPDHPDAAVHRRDALIAALEKAA